jgi:hypothetical protein
MRLNRRYTLSRARFALFLPVLLVIPLLLVLAGCNASPNDSANEETRTALSIQQTDVAEKVQGEGSLSSEDRQATRAVQEELGGQDTGVDSKPAPTKVDTPQPEQALPTATVAPAATQTAEPTQGPDFQSWMRSANILLYEDMTGYLDTTRYVKDTLDSMGLSYKDDGSAKGWLKTDLLSGPPQGGAWDLVIIAAEAKSGVQGEFFQYVMDALDQGSSVILEVWYLDQTYGGVANALLSRCGVEFQNDWEEVPPQAMVMFPTDSSHPILHEPNTLTFTKVSDYWWDPEHKTIYDIGDRVQLVPGSKAQILVSTHPNYHSTHGTLTVCLDDQLILQTFSTHQLSFESMSQAWENYILHALKTHFGSQK